MESSTRTDTAATSSGAAVITRSFDVLVIGGGTAGITAAAQLRRRDSKLDVGIIEPSDTHYYQPAWTLVGGGDYDLEDTARPERDVIPRGATWLKDRAETIDPEEQWVETKNGERYGYEYLVVAPGIQIDWDKLEGLEGAVGSHGICSNYRYEYAPYTWECIRRFSGGRALFTQPSTPIKCGGAPQKIMYLASDYWRKQGILDQADIRFCTPGTVIFGVEEFARTLRQVVSRYGIDVAYKHDLIAVRPEKKEAVFRVSDNGEEEKVIPYEMIHVVPPQSAPDFIKQSPLADENGWVDVDAETLQHAKYPTVFSLGDASNLPTAKTGAAVRKEAPVLVENLLQHMRTNQIDKPKIYNGYSSCPLTTGYGKLVLAEFDYDNNPDPSFPFDTTKERYSMYLLKKYGLPFMYWNGMLKGWA